MELFTAGDESQMEVIKRWIAESDVFLLILGGRYGSLEPQSGKSYIECEYDYAVFMNRPFFTCVVRDEAQRERVKQYGLDIVEQENPALCAITGSNLWVCSASGETITLRLFTMSGALNALDPDSISPFSAAHISSVRTLRAPQD
jgi:hypothetical protein